MPTRKTNIAKNIDWFTVVLYLILITLGWFSIYGAVYNSEDTVFWDFSLRYGKQLVWIGFALVIATVLLLLDSGIYNVFAYFIYGFMILLLIVTIFVAPDIKGSRSWLVLGPVSLQPAELAKTATCLAIAKFMSAYEFKIQRLRDALTLGAIAFVPMLLIILQSETGSALVYLALFLVFYRQGMPGIFLFLGFCAVVVFILSIRYGIECIIPAFPDESLGLFIVILLATIIQIGFLLLYNQDRQNALITLGIHSLAYIVCLILYKGFSIPVRFTYAGFIALFLSSVNLLVNAFMKRKSNYILIVLFGLGSIAFSGISEYAFEALKPHQQVRIKVTLGMENDPKKSGYNVNQSKIAIGSGGFSGKGFLNGTQTKLKYVPEQDTDFIFCTVGEEHGFVGTCTVLLLFLTLILRLISLAERQRSLFSRIYGYCVACIFFFHLFINIGMVIGLTPVIGIPLPFFSYGGSSLWGFTILLFIFLRLDASRTEYFG